MILKVLWRRDIQPTHDIWLVYTWTHHIRLWCIHLFISSYTTLKPRSLSHIGLLNLDSFSASTFTQKGKQKKKSPRLSLPHLRIHIGKNTAVQLCSHMSAGVSVCLSVCYCQEQGLECMQMHLNAYHEGFTVTCEIIGCKNLPFMHFSSWQNFAWGAW